MSDRKKDARQGTKRFVYPLLKGLTTSSWSPIQPDLGHTLIVKLLSILNCFQPASGKATACMDSSTQIA
jgi:hypothetical protein